MTILKTTARETSRGLEHNDDNGNENFEKPHFLINFFDVYCTKETRKKRSPKGSPKATQVMLPRERKKL